MAQLVGKYAANKLLKKHMKKYESKKQIGGEVRGHQYTRKDSALLILPL